MLVPPPSAEFINNAKCPSCGAGRLIKGEGPGSHPVLRRIGWGVVTCSLIICAGMVLYGLIWAEPRDRFVFIALAILPLFKAYTTKMYLLGKTTTFTCSYCRKQK